MNKSTKDSSLWVFALLESNMAMGNAPYKSRSRHGKSSNYIDNVVANSV